MRRIIRKIRLELRENYYARMFSKKGSKKLDKAKPIYYIIRRKPRSGGFFSNYIYVLGHIVYAVEQGLYPVVDMEHYATFYSEKQPVEGTRNAWEYYFKQPSGTSLRDAYRSGNYILSEDAMQKEGIRFLDEQYYGADREAVAFYSGFIRKYIPFRESLQAILTETERKLGIDARNTLGVHYRGTDMKAGSFEGHLKTSALDAYLEKVDACLSQFPELTGIFLATDEEAAVEKFKNRYGEMVCCSEGYRAQGEQAEGIHYAGGNGRSLHAYRMGLEVCVDVHALSACHTLICGHSNVATAAILWNENRYKEIWVI